MSNCLACLVKSELSKHCARCRERICDYCSERYWLRKDNLPVFDFMYHQIKSTSPQHLGWFHYDCLPDLKEIIDYGRIKKLP